MGPETLLDVPAPGASGTCASLVARGPALWSSLTSEQARSRADELAAALRAYGLQDGNRLAILADAGPDAAVALLAAGRAGATAVVLDPDLAGEPLAAALRDRAAVQAVAGDERRLQALLALRADLPDLELVLIARPEVSDRPSPALRVEAACRAGAQGLTEAPRVRTAVEPALELVGVDGGWRAWSHASLLLNAERLITLLALGAADTVVSPLPATHPDLAPLLAACLVRRARLVFAEPAPAGFSLATVGDAEASVAVVTATDLTALQRQLVAESEKRSWAGRKLHAWAVEQGRNPRRHPRAHRAAEALVLRGARAGAGPALRLIQVLGRPPDPETVAFLRAVGFPVAAPPPQGR